MREIWSYLLEHRDVITFVVTVLGPVILAPVMKMIKRSWRTVVLPFFPLWAFSIMWASDALAESPVHSHWLYLAYVVASAASGIYAVKWMGTDVVRVRHAEYERGAFLTAACNRIKCDVTDSTWSIVASITLQDNAPLLHTITGLSAWISFMDKVSAKLDYDVAGGEALPRQTKCLRQDRFGLKGTTKEVWPRQQYASGVPIWVRMVVNITLDTGREVEIEIPSRLSVETTNVQPVSP